MAIVDVLKFDGSSEIFAWKYPNSELATSTQLIVNESQEAVLVKNGQIADVFGPGRYTLSTDNIPILQKIVNIPFGKKSPFSAEVWFINRVFSLDIKWGTTTPIQIQDPKYNVFVPVRAFGQFGIQIEDSKRFLIKLVGTMKFFNKNTLSELFRGLFVTRVKDRISSCLIKAKISMLEINAHLNEISDELTAEFQSELKDYGIKIVSFYVNDINVPENDPAVKQLKAALAKRAEMDILGYSYQQERTFDTLESASSNAGTAGAVMGAGMGLGMGVGMGAQMQSMVASMNTQSPTKECPQCRKQVDANTKFCPHCGCNIAETSEPQSEHKCSECGAAFADKKKFCSECGRKFNLCPACGDDIPDGASACPSCQSKLCPQCGAVIAKNAKFCPECGYTAVIKCPSCGEVVANGQKFCANCGTKI
jgi:membrane protease subunit (stomatin/prohibitin family)